MIAVVIYGLYGSANSKWNMSSAVTESPVFDSFWDTISFMLNGIVFFYAGASSVNFFWRSSEVPPTPPLKEPLHLEFTPFDPRLTFPIDKDCKILHPCSSICNKAQAGQFGWCTNNRVEDYHSIQPEQQRCSAKTL